MSRIVAERWTACPPGEFDRLEAHLRWTRFLMKAATIGAAVAATAALATASWIVAGAVTASAPLPSTGSGACPVVAPCKPCNE